MATKTVTVRFYQACRGVSDGFTWPPKAVLRDMLAAKLPRIGDDGVTIAHDGTRYLVEQEHVAEGVLHCKVSVDLDEVPSIRHQAKTSQLTLQPGDVPTSMAHIVFLPNGVVAIARGLVAPTPHISAAVLSDATSVPFILLPLVRTDQLTVLNNSTGVSTLELTVVNVDPVVAAGDPLLDAIDKLAHLQTYEVSVKIVARRAADKVKLRSSARAILEEEQKGRIKAKRGRAALASAEGRRWVDLLDDQIAEQATVNLQLTPSQAASTLSPTDVRAAMTRSYNELDTIIGSALATTPTEFPEP